MRIDEAWEYCADEVLRPVIRAEIIAVDGSPVVTPFIVDTGADRTVLNRDILDELALRFEPLLHPVEGIGGAAASVEILAEIRFNLHDGGQASFTLRCAGVTDAAALDMSLLGRDILDHFAVIVDRPGNTVCLLNQRHRYGIIAS